MSKPGQQAMEVFQEWLEFLLFNLQPYLQILRTPGLLEKEAYRKSTEIV